MATTMLYIDPDDETTRTAMQRARDAVGRRQEDIDKACRVLEEECHGRRDKAGTPSAQGLNL
jgi:hypothetical protein